jgi:hypothetical protein
VQTDAGVVFVTELGRFFELMSFGAASALLLLFPDLVFDWR